MKAAWMLLAPLLLTGCEPRTENQRQKDAANLDIWQKVSLVLSDHPSEEEAERLITSVLAAHNTVASNRNVENMVGALLRFRDQDNVNEMRVLACMNSGVKSPTGNQWQDTMAYCVTELAS